MTGIMRRPEIREASGALGFILAGEPGESGVTDIVAAENAQQVLWDVPRGGVMVAFSIKELELLWIAIENGAEALLQSSSGLRVDQRNTFKTAANRLAEAGRITRPRF
jgi:hypothetical protein